MAVDTSGKLSAPPEPCTALSFVCVVVVDLLLDELAGVDLARAPEARLHLHRLAPVAEDTGRAGGDGERSEDADIEATEDVLANDLVCQCM